MLLLGQAGYHRRYELAFDRHSCSLAELGRGALRAAGKKIGMYAYHLVCMFEVSPPLSLPLQQKVASSFVLMCLRNESEMHRYEALES